MVGNQSKRKTTLNVTLMEHIYELKLMSTQQSCIINHRLALWLLKKHTSGLEMMEMHGNEQP